MINVKVHVLIIIFLSIGSAVSKSCAQTVSDDHLDGVVYVKLEGNSGIELTPYDSSLADMNTLIFTHRITEILRPFDGLGNDTLDHTYRFHFDSIADVVQLIQGLEALNYVHYAERAPLFRTVSTPDDIHPDQWYLEKINAVEAWDVTTGDAAVTIAIVDNAVLLDHEDLSADLWVNPGETENGFDSDLNGYTDDIHGYDVADGNNDPNPPAGAPGGFSHGTHCAGIAAAVTNNGVGIAGLGYNSKIISVKCTPDNSDGNVLTHAYEGLRYAVDAGADIVSMSWGSRAGSFTGDALLNTANIRGITMFAAAGNEDEDDIFSPASHQNVMAVGSTDQGDKKSGFSNYGSEIAFMAPGSSIWSTLAGTQSDYGYSSGTSMACPLAAGLGALVKAYAPSFTPGQIRTAMENGCDNIDDQNPNYTGQIGAGRINAGKTLNLLTSVTDLKKSDGTLFAYPNPVHHTLKIKAKGEAAAGTAPFQLKVYNAAGVCVKEHRLSPRSSGEYEVGGFQSLPAGMYFLEVETTGKVFRKKLAVVGR